MKTHADEAGLERLQRVVAAMPKCVLRRAETTPTPNSRAMSMAAAMALVATTKPKPFWPSSEPTIGVTRSTFRSGFGIDQSAPHAVEILRQELQAMGIDAAQVGAHQATGHGGGVFFGQAMRDQQAAAEGLGRLRLGIDRTLRRSACGLSLSSS